MGIYTLLLLASIMATETFSSCCDKNLIYDLSFRLSGTRISFPCSSTKDIYTCSDRYIPKNIIPTRMQMGDETAIVVIPRYRHGVPITLAKFDMKSKSCKVTLEPFPCWKIQEEGNCNAIQNAIDLVLDALKRLWVLDLGICNTLEQPVRRCPPKIWGFKADSGELLKTISLESLVTAESRLQYLVIDYSPKGVPFAFISDAGTGAILVVNLQLGRGFRVILPPAVGAGCSEKDILYLQLARKSCGNVVYVTYLSSPRLFSIKSELLQQGQTAGAVIDVGCKPPGTQVVFLGNDNGCAMFFRFKGECDIYIWNSNTAFKRENFVLVQEGGDCRLATQVVPGWKKFMWAIESNFYDYITGTTGCLGASVAVYPLVKTGG